MNNTELKQRLAASPSSSFTSRQIPSLEPVRIPAGKAAAVAAIVRKQVANAPSDAPVSLNTKTSIPTGRSMTIGRSSIISAPGRSATSAARSTALPVKAGGVTSTPATDLKNRPFTEFSVRVPKAIKKEHSLMRFNAAYKVDFDKWTSVKLQREDNSSQYKLPTFANKVEMPKFGAGSEFGREEREEARRAKYGMHRRKYKPEDQPWTLKIGDKINKKFKGLKEGGVSENASYFVFTQAKDGHFDVYPVKNWYNFTPVQKYKALSAEEAEEEFSRRNKVMNLFSVMVRKRMKIDEQEEGDNKKDQVNRALKMSEMEDWADDDEDGSADSGDEDKEEKDAKKKKAAKKNPKKKKKDSDDEPLEDSDDGDDEGRELDYISDSSEPSEDEEEKKPDLPGVGEESRQADSDSDSSGSGDEEEKTGETEKKVEAEKKSNSKSKKKKKKEVKEEVKKTDDPGSENEDGDESMEKSDYFPAEGEHVVKEEGSSLKRKASDLVLPPSKKTKVEVSGALLTQAASEGITEEAVRKYLFRKPMTVAELLQKFKPKKTKIPNEDMVPIIAHILKKINPTKRTQNNKMYFFLKT